jgi:phospholipase C
VSARSRLEQHYEIDDLAIVVRVTNRAGSVRVTLANAYGNEEPVDGRLRAGETFEKKFCLESSFGWYDITVQTDADRAFLRRRLHWTIAICK